MLFYATQNQNLLKPFVYWKACVLIYKEKLVLMPFACFLINFDFPYAFAVRGAWNDVIYCSD